VQGLEDLFSVLALILAELAGTVKGSFAPLVSLSSES
jgi:hypothetical protein